VIIQNINVSKLTDEFNRGGIKILHVLYVYNDDDTQADFIFAGGTDMDLVQQIINAHDPTPIPPKPTDKERIEQLENMILMMMEVM